MKKYELTNEMITIDGRTLYRIKALKDFGNVKKGDLGGFVENKSNLSHEDNCWVYGDARVCGNAGVYGDAGVFGNAEVYGDARVYGDAGVYGDARVTKAVINIIGFPYNTTLTDNHIQIGCKQLTFNQALRLAENWEKTLKKFKEAKEIESIKPILIELIKYRMKEKRLRNIRKN